jgi:hypothetical protein
VSAPTETVAPPAAPPGVGKVPHADPRGRVLVAVAVGVVVATLVAVASGVGLIRGPVGLVLLVGAWVFVPSAATLSRRLALNGAVALGVVPVLWWVKWPLVFGVGHSALLLSALLGFIAFLLVWSPRHRRGILPRVSWADLIPVGGAIFSIWYFLPFVRVHSGTGSVAMLINGWGNDNVGHFEMFSMIRRTLVTGLGWGDSVPGSPYAYTNYPQHFHVLVAFAAELLHGPSLGTVDTEIGLYGLGTGVVLSIAVVTLLAAIASCRPLRRHPGIALIAGAGVVSFALLGMGSDAISYGFPGFLLAILGTLIACVIGLGEVRTGRSTLLAVAAMLVLVAHTWSLLAPLAFVPFVFALLRYPWPENRRNPRALIVPGLIVAFALAGVGYAGLLVYLATYTVGSMASVLTIGGGFPQVSVLLEAVIAGSVIGVAAGWASRLPFTRLRAASRAPHSRIDMHVVALIAAVIVVGSTEALGLVVIQLRQSPSLSYYQLKFIYGITIVFGVLALVLVGSWIARSRQSRPGPSIRWLEGLSVGVLVAAVLASSSYVGQPLGEPLSFTPPGVRLRTALQVSVNSSPAMTSRILDAATIMQSRPCARPVYVALLPDDLPADQSNQWAMSFSGNWTQSAAPINTLLFETQSDTPKVDATRLVDNLLAADDTRCVIVAPQVKKTIDTSAIEKFRGRIILLGD